MHASSPLTVFLSFKFNLTYKRHKAHHKTNEEPNSGSDGPETSLGEALSPEQAVGDGVDHEHGDGGEHAAQVEHVTRVRVVADARVQGEPPAREEEEARQHRGHLVPLLRPVNVVYEVR